MAILSTQLFMITKRMKAFGTKTVVSVDLYSKREKWGAGEIRPENGSLPHKTGE